MNQQVLLAPAVRLYVCVSDGTLPLVDAGFPRDGDEVMKVGRGRDAKFGVGTAAVCGVCGVASVEVAVRSKFKIYQRIVRPKRYTQAHDL